MSAQTPAQRQAARRARQAEAGLTEVRGIWAPPAHHDAIRKAATKLLAQLKKTVL